MGRSDDDEMFTAPPLEREDSSDLRDRAVSAVKKKAARRSVSMASHTHGYGTRGVVFGASLFTLLIGGMMVAMGTYGAFTHGSGSILEASAQNFGLNRPSMLLPRALGGSWLRAAGLTYGSIAVGSAMALCGCIGLLGACRRSRCCICAYCLAAFGLLIFGAAASALTWQARWAVGQWEAAEFRLAGPVRITPPEGGLEPVLSDKALRTIQVLHADFAALYTFCEPDPAGVQAILSDLDAWPRRVPAKGTSFVCAQRSMVMFESWVLRYCLNATDGYAGQSGFERLGEIALCRTDAATLGSNFAHDATSAKASWLFCTCGRPLARYVSERWFGPSMVGMYGLLLYLVCLICSARIACTGAAKAARRKREERVQLLMEQQAQKPPAAFV